MLEITYACYPQSEISRLPLFHNRAAVVLVDFVGIQTFGSDTSIIYVIL